MPVTAITSACLTKGRHQTFKKTGADIVHYVVVVKGCVVASLELNTSLCGNYWVRHSVSEISHQGYGYALYQLAMQDVYPLGIMPSRECTSGHAISLWAKLFKQQNITQIPVVHPKVYCDEFDEWLDEIVEVNPSLDEDAIALLEKEHSYIDSVQKGFMKPHPYNMTYHLKLCTNFNVIETEKSKYFKASAELFNQRYDTLDL